MIANAEQLNQLIKHQQLIPSTQLKQLVTHISQVPLTTDLLEADSMLWGSFWQFDVIAPGYTLPASELALLRAIRLDQSWPEDTTVEQFLDDLHQTIRHPKAGIWSIKVAEQPCLVFAATIRQTELITVVWYCILTNKLHAGYQTTPPKLFLPEAIEQRCPDFSNNLVSNQTNINNKWLANLAEQNSNRNIESLTARLDAEIIRIRAATV